MNRIKELHDNATSLLTLANSELRKITEISISDQNAYDKEVHIKEHIIRWRRQMRSYLRVIREIERIIQGEVI